MSSLFDVPVDATPAFEEPGVDAPLAERLRPRSLEEFVGQRHLVAPGKILAKALAGDLRQSLILWGPAGTGKTTLARLLARASGLRFVPFSAVLSGIKEIKAVMADAARVRKRTNRPVLLFVDEIHRFNKAQQDAFLPYVESGAGGVGRRHHREPLLLGHRPPALARPHASIKLEPLDAARPGRKPGLPGPRGRGARPGRARY